MIIKGTIMEDEVFDNYEPDEEEIKEIDKIFEEEEKNNKLIKNRLTFVFNSNSHFEGWLRVNGIKW